MPGIGRKEPNLINKINPILIINRCIIIRKLILLIVFTSS